jgi:hypothetical protein
LNDCNDSCIFFFDGDVGYHLGKKTLLRVIPCGTLTAVKAKAAAIDNETMSFGLRHGIVVEYEKRKKKFCSCRSQ